MATLIILLLTYGINISEIIADKASFDKINAREEDDRSLQVHDVHQILSEQLEYAYTYISLSTIYDSI